MPIVIFDLDESEFQDVGWLPPSEIDAFIELVKKYGISTDANDYKFFGEMNVSFWNDKLQFVIEASHKAIDAFPYN